MVSLDVLCSHRYVWALVKVSHADREGCLVGLVSFLQSQPIKEYRMQSLLVGSHFYSQEDTKRRRAMSRINLLKTCSSRKWQTGRFHSLTTKVYPTDVFLSEGL